jgi:hypothetical protein
VRRSTIQRQAAARAKPPAIVAGAEIPSQGQRAASATARRLFAA